MRRDQDADEIQLQDADRIHRARVADVDGCRIVRPVQAPIAMRRASSIDRTRPPFRGNRVRVK